MSDRERLVRDELERFRLGDEAPAEERAWRVVVAASEAGIGAPARRRRRGRRAIQLALVVGLIAALVSPAGASVRHWVADRIEPPGAPHAAPRLAALPGHASLLVDSPRGPWVVHPDGSKRLLGDWTAASWSPHGLFAVVTKGDEIAAVTPEGDVRWALARPGTVGKARWNGPDGERIAYLAGHELRVVDGDGTGDRPLADHVSWVAPAWQPGPAHVVAYATPSGTVAAVAADTDRVVFRAKLGAVPTGLAWAGGQLFVLGSGSIRALSSAGRTTWAWTPPPGTRIVTATPAPDGRHVAVVVRAGATSRVLLVPRGGAARGAGRTLFAGPGGFGAPTWAPDGKWLLVPWRSADQWLFLRPGAGSARLHAVDGVAAQFAPGQAGAARFPTVVGWNRTR
jgi:hypothetical protein